IRGGAPRANAARTIVGKSGLTICKRRKRQRKGLDNIRAAWKAEAIGGEYSSGKISQDLPGRSIQAFVGNGRFAFKCCGIFSLDSDEAPETETESADDSVAGGCGEVVRTLQVDDLPAGVCIGLRDFG